MVIGCVTMSPLQLTLAYARALAGPLTHSRIHHVPNYYSHARVLQHLDTILPLSHPLPKLSPVQVQVAKTGSHNALGDIERAPPPSPSLDGFGVSIRLPAHK